MAKITIRDLDKGILAFDLRDLLRALAPHSTAAWTITSPDESSFEATGAGGMRLEELAESSSTIRGDELLVLADDTVQVTGVTLWASCRKILTRHAVTIRAVDSSFYEVESSEGFDCPRRFELRRRPLCRRHALKAARPLTTTIRHSRLSSGRASRLHRPDRRVSCAVRHYAADTMTLNRSPTVAMLAGAGVLGAIVGWDRSRQRRMDAMRSPPRRCILPSRVTSGVSVNRDRGTPGAAAMTPEPPVLRRSTAGSPATARKTDGDTDGIACEPIAG